MIKKMDMIIVTVTIILMNYTNDDYADESLTRKKFYSGCTFKI